MGAVISYNCDNILYWSLNRNSGQDSTQLPSLSLTAFRVSSKAARIEALYYLDMSQGVRRVFHGKIPDINGPIGMISGYFWFRITYPGMHTIMWFILSRLWYV